MPDTADFPSTVAEAPSRSRLTLLRRLIDVVAMPSSRLPPQDRSMAGDVLLEILFEASDKERAFAARRLVPTHEAPRRVLRYLAQCPVEVCEDLLLENEAFDDSDLSFLIDSTTPEHARIVARRKTLGPAVCDAIVRGGDALAIKHALSNRRAFISEAAMDEIVTQSRDFPEITTTLINREELRPNQALLMFWWSDPDVRLQILMRFSADRAELIEMCADVFAMAAAEGWRDPVARKTLQLIERRQRNRAAIDRSPFDHLEAAIEHAEKEGLSRTVAEEIGYLAGLKPVTLAKILTDPGGEGLAVLCKATGLKREYFRKLWSALKRPTESQRGLPDKEFLRVSEVYEMLSVAKAQTTLRYWNWSLTSALKPSRDRDEDRELETTLHTFSTTRNAARLVFGQR